MAVGDIVQFSGKMDGPSATVTVSGSAGQPSVWATPTSGNTLVALFWTGGGTITPASGWTERHDAGTDSPNQLRRLLYDKVSDGTETSVVWTSTNSATSHGLVLYEIEGAVTFDVAVSADNTAVETVNSGSTGTLAAASSIAIALGQHWTTSDTSFSDSYTLDGDYDGGNNNALYRMGFGHKALTSTAATSTANSWTGSGNGSTSVIVYSIPSGFAVSPAGIGTTTMVIKQIHKLLGSISSWGDGVAFMERTPSSQIQLTGVSGTPSSPYIIEGYEFENIPYVSSNSHVCILLTNCVDVLVRYNDFDTVGQPIAIFGGSNITVEWNRCRNITGPSTRTGNQTGNFIQTVNAPDNVTIQDNKIIGGDTEDIISLYSATNSIVQRNHIQGAKAGITGDGWTSASGTGIILGDGSGANCQALDNILYLPGQVGIAVAGGENMFVRRNKILQPSQDPRASSNVGAYANNYYGLPYGGHEFTDNRVRVWSDSASVWNGFWNNGGVVVETGNDWSDSSLESEDLTVTL